MQSTGLRPTASRRPLRSELRAQSIERARNLLEVGLTVGDRGAIAGGLAALVRRPGTSGRTYAPSGENDLSSTFPSAQLAIYAMNRAIAVVPGKAYVVLDVDYDRADDWQTMLRQADDLVELARRSSVPVARVSSGAAQRGRPANEHIWLVLGDYGFRPVELARLRLLLPAAYPLLAVRGAVTGVKLAGQLIRPPGGRHRSGVWAELPDPVQLFDTLASPGPPAHGWSNFVAGLEVRLSGATPHRRPPRATPYGDGEIDARAARELRDGLEAEDDRSDAAASLILRLYGCGWSPDRIVSALMVSPAGRYMRSRLGKKDPYTRIREDVERVIGKYGHRVPTAARQRLRERGRKLSDQWAQWLLPEDPLWFTRSGRILLRALLDEVVRTGHPTVTAQQRTLADSSGLGVATVNRTLQRFETHGLADLVRDEHGYVRACRPDLEAIARIGSLHERSGTPVEHTPGHWEPAPVRHDAWAHRSAGAPAAVRLGRPCQRVLALLEAGPCTTAELADRYGRSLAYAAQLLRRLAAHHVIIRAADGTWHPHSADPCQALDVAAARLATSGLLDQRGARYAADRKAWVAAQSSTDSSAGTDLGTPRLLVIAEPHGLQRCSPPRAGPALAAA